MYFSWLDLFVATLTITELVYLTFFIMFFSLSSLANKFDVFFPIATVLIGVLLFGLLTAIYLAIYRRLFRYKDGEYKLKSWEYFFWKLDFVLRELATKALCFYLPTFARALLYRILGARIGFGTCLFGEIDDPHFTQIGKNCFIGRRANLSAHYVSADQFVVKAIKIGNNVTVGENCLVMSGVQIGDHAVIAAGSVVFPGTEIPAGELWSGNPARKMMKL